MEGLAQLDSRTIIDLISEIETLKNIITPAVVSLKKARRQYLSVSDVMDMTGFKKAWVYNRKERIGFSDVDGSIVFRREDVEDFMNSNYFKAKN